MVKSPAIALMSSGRKEYSATKITAYFSPKPSPITSPKVVEADMPPETRERTAQAQIANEVKVNETPRPERSTPSTAQLATETKVNGTPAKSTRNIDKVVFGDLLVDCSYTSRHVREIVGDKVAEGKEMLDRLCVCPHCFKYTQEIVKYLGHVQVCERRRDGAEGMLPGKRIYRHGKSGWQVWEVDGEDDGVSIAVLQLCFYHIQSYNETNIISQQLYCQNLSLFAKLFLGDKSVSFDVSSFIYYLLVHTCPITGSSQVVGFFSKEKQSWDDNNLACILIFPPWQRKGLGSILMGISYEIAKQEGLIGGPEKPLSELGKRGYLRFWSGEIARWLLGREEGMATCLEEISRVTWILKEDCMEALREMGILDESRSQGDEVTRIDQKLVRQWVERTKTSLLPTVDSNGWLNDFYRRERPGEIVEEETEE